MRTHVERLTKLYANNEQSSDYLDTNGLVTVPSEANVRRCLGVGPPDTRAAERKWRDRNWGIGGHKYSRGRDENRAFRVNDFNLAHALDDGTGVKPPV